MTTATIEGVEIEQMWGDQKQFRRRVAEYAEGVGACYGFVIPLTDSKDSVSHVFQ